MEDVALGSAESAFTSAGLISKVIIEKQKSSASEKPATELETVDEPSDVEKDQDLPEQILLFKNQKQPEEKLKNS